MPITQFPASVSVTNLNGLNGFSITGYPTTSGGGWSVSGVGDVNADGIADFLIGAPYAYSATGTGVSYLIFGKSGLGSTGSIDVSSLTGTNGFAITGFPTNSQAGLIVSGLGDVNHDGIADLAVGAPNASSGAGACYVIFGRSGLGSTGSIDVSSLTGANGFVITGFSANAAGGFPISGAGDVNDDGIADLVVGSNAGSPYAGEIYVIFGKSGLGSSGSFSVSTLTGSNGFIFMGLETSGDEGWSVSGVGDVNGDGIADLLVGAADGYSEAGSAYVIFGKSGLGSSGSFTVSSLTGSNGFVITGFPTHDFGGYSVSGAGDVNHDGIKDIIVAAPAAASGTGASYVIFGRSGLGNSGSIDVSSLTGSNGFLITGFPAGALAGQSVSEAGDINSDGIADLLIGAPYMGATYVIFGQSGFGHSGSLSVSSLSGINGFVINGFPANSRGGWYVSGVGDVNDDGISDLLIGAYNAFSTTGASYVIFGESSVSLLLSENNLHIKEGQTVTLNSQNLNATNPIMPSKDSSLQFTLSNIKHGYFFTAANTSLPLTQFTQKQVRNGQIQFMQDGSGYAPTYNVSVGYSGMFEITLPQAAAITFQATVQLVNNNLIINQGQTIVFNTNNLYATSPSSSSFTFTASNVQHGYFALTSSSTTAITSFTQTQIQNGKVQFVQDGTSNPPAYSISVNDGSTSTPAQAATISFDIPPTLTANTLTINQGQTVVLTSSNVSASDPYATSFTFSVSNVQYGYFALTSAPTTPVTSFTSAQIQSGGVQFVQDGSNNAPIYSVTVSDGRMSSATQAATILFDTAPTLSSNTLTINQSQTIVLDSTNLSATPNTSPLTYIVSNVQHGYFALRSNPTNAITSFTQIQIQNGDVQFVQDGSSNPPSYDVAVTNGQAASSAQAATISFDVPPTLTANVLTLYQGEALILTSSNLSASDPYTSNFTFTVSQVQHGYFALTGSPTTSITSFTQDQIGEGVVQFVHDGSASAPTYFVSVSDGRMSSASQAGVVTFSLDQPPVLVKNALSVQQGQAVILNSNDLSATDTQHVPSGLTFTVSEVQHGYFSILTTPNVIVADPSTSVTSFIQSQIDTGLVEFVPDGGPLAPSYSVSVSDGYASTTPVPAAITFIPSNVSTNSSDNNVRNAIIGGTVSGGIGLIFLGLKLCLTRRAAISLQKAIAGGESDTEKRQAALHKEVIRPIANKVFERINTSGFLGYRSESDARAYIAAIETIIGKLTDLGVDLNLSDMGALQQNKLLNEIAKQTRKCVVPKHDFCSLLTIYNFFKAEATPQQIEDKADEIAQAVQQSLSSNLNKGSTSPKNDDDVEMADVKVSYIAT